MNVISLKNVEKRFKDQSVIKDISLQINQGEIFGLLGPSGSGKTTLIKMIVGIEKPSKGEIKVLDKKMPSFDILGKIGYMGQLDSLYEDLTGMENLKYFGRLNNIKRRDIEGRINPIIERLGLKEDIDKLVCKYSGGMKKRLSLASALIHNPLLLILDEPTVGIDPVLRKEIWNLFDDIKKMGTTLIITTHIMEEADRCERICLIREGEILSIGKTEDLKKEAKDGKLENLFF